MDQILSEVIVEGIPKDWDEGTVEKIFQSAGSIESIKSKLDSDSPGNKWRIQYRSAPEALTAIFLFNNRSTFQVLHGHKSTSMEKPLKISIDYSKLLQIQNAGNSKSIGAVEIDSDESWEIDEEASQKMMDNTNSGVKFEHSSTHFFSSERFNPVYFNDGMITLTKMTRGVDLPLSYIHVNDPGNFYVQFEHKREDLEYLNAKLNEYGGKTPPIDYTYNLSELCLALYDGQWRRASVLEKQPRKSASMPGASAAQQWYKVHFMDYGNDCSVESTNMRPLIRSFMQIPVQTYCCKLAGITAIGGSNTGWSRASIDCLKELVANKELVKSIRIVGESGIDGHSIVRMEVEAPNSPKCTDVGTMLIERGHAKKSSSNKK